MILMVLTRAEFSWGGYVGVNGNTPNSGRLVAASLPFNPAIVHSATFAGARQSHVVEAAIGRAAAGPAR